MVTAGALKEDLLRSGHEVANFVSVADKEEKPTHAEEVERCRHICQLRMREICSKVRDRISIKRISVAVRIGRVFAGDMKYAIAVSAPAWRNAMGGVELASNMLKRAIPTLHASEDNPPDLSEDCQPQLEDIPSPFRVGSPPGFHGSSQPHFSSLTFGSSEQEATPMQPRQEGADWRHAQPQQGGREE